MALSKIIYVYEEEEGNGDKYLLAVKSMDECEEGLIGVYELTEKMKVRRVTEMQREGTKTWFK